MNKILSIALCAMLSLTAWAGCDLDFNNDGRFNRDDSRDRLAVLAGAEMPHCDSIDFNGDGVFPDDADELAWETAVVTGVCPDGFTANRQAGPTVTVRPGDDLTKALMSLRWTGGTIAVSPGVHTTNIRWDDQNGTVIPNVSIVGIPDARGERPVFRLTTTDSALRITGNNTLVQGITIEAPKATKVIHVMGKINATIEDVVIRGGGIGVAIEGLGTGGGEVVINRSIIRDLNLVGPHNQGVYISDATGVVIRESVFYNIGDSQFDQGIYSVHGHGYRTFVNNWFNNPGFAGIQCRGGTRYLVMGNVFDRCGNAVGIGHPMGTAWVTSGIFSNNLVINPKWPFWGMALQNGDGVSVDGNILLANGQGYAFQIENPSKSITVTNTALRGWDRERNHRTPLTTAGITWGPQTGTPKGTPRVPWEALLSRPMGTWGLIYQTSTTISEAQ